MKTIFISILTLILLSSATCNKEGEDCHYSIANKNNSNIEVIFAKVVNNADNDCNLDGVIVKSNGTFDYYPYNGCIENELDNNSSIDIYIVNPNHYNDPSSYYDCDSIYIKNTVLKHFELSLDDLKQNDFTISYP